MVSSSLDLMADELPESVPAAEESGAAPVAVIAESDHPIREQQLDREALKVLYRLRDAGFKGYLVGGGVRDLYLGRTPKDFDISTDARPGQLRQMFRNSRTIGRRFRLVQVFFKGNKIIEVSTLRSRSEYDIDGEEQVLPSNNTFGTLEEDAFRRDLTINALFYEIEHHTIIDYTGGVRDLDQGIIRVVGDPDRRFTRDPVRMMRVVRHAARTGFAIEEATFTALRQHKDKLGLCPPSRLRDEVLKDLQSGASRPWAELCMATGLWTTLFALYEPLLAGEHGERIRQDLLRLFSVLDRIHARCAEEEPVKIPEHLLFAALLLPWACERFGLPETNVRGSSFHSLSCSIREDVDAVFGEPFNVQRMAKESLTTLLINLSTFHHARSQGSDPKWLKKKSYYRDCSRFYDIYMESQGMAAVSDESFTVERVQEAEVVAVMPSTAEGSGGSRGKGRGGMNPAFSSTKAGVFGLRRPRE
ncbi:MAG: poly(A) polymerase [Desulfobulbus sp.]|jgi:poly(A) polymerase|uniref:poly(A) polymerase n=1 Tax=Desulfobulbus sp. TaxID=895 RepID=UPI00284B6CD8|nr:poly(A) polymerase [Desulfobulbus sp.]MDR2550699.1 poly(A) polymerase [Desulfobulbus sp.]